MTTKSYHITQKIGETQIMMWPACGFGLYCPNEKTARMELTRMRDESQKDEFSLYEYDVVQSPTGDIIGIIAASKKLVDPSVSPPPLSASAKEIMARDVEHSKQLISQYPPASAAEAQPALARLEGRADVPGLSDHIQVHDCECTLTTPDERRKNVDAYIQHVLTHPDAYPHEHYVWYRDGKYVTSAKQPDLADRSGDTIIKHYDRDIYLKSFPDQPPLLKLTETVKEPASIKGHYFRCVFPPQHLMAAQWGDAVFFPSPVNMRITFDEHAIQSGISIERTERPEYFVLNYYKEILVSASFIDKLRRLHDIDRSRNDILNMLIKVV